ncbi:DNA polymerase III subunit delta' [Streptococcus halichoeri]|uniref:DNA polymerase III subunit delta' n=1 Tax=Streptococcus halichoeri TaxID=254785 RepID=UPI00135CC3D4|nr:DNA polymerase III subunit delta' [Streptococcus halichoeri]
MAIQELAPEIFQQFQQIIGHNRLSHAYLFAGDYANYDMAIYLAQALFCEQPKDHLPCGHCRTCHLIAQEDYADVTLLEPAGQVIKTETVRDMLRQFSSTGYESNRQVFIVKDCEKMHTNAANSLLKYIEEPQSDSYIFLLTNDENQVLPTIKSRTQIFRFPRNQDYLVQQAQQQGLLKSQAQLLAQLAKNPAHLEVLMADNKLLDLINGCQRFVDLLLSQKAQAYIEVSRISQLAPEKQDQDRTFQLLTVLLSSQYGAPWTLHYLEGLYQARLMWQSNVSFQNALEYMVIT